MKTYIFIIISIFLFSFVPIADVKKSGGIKVYSVKYDYQADLKVFKAKYSYQADLKIFFVEYQYQAGWNNKSKMNLLF